MNASNRLPIILGFSCLVLSLLIYFQWGSISLLAHKIEGREDRITSLKTLIFEHPELMTPKKGSTSQSLTSEHVERSLTAMFSQMINEKNLDPHMVSLTPSFDNKKKLNKIRCQLKSLSLEKTLDFIQSLKNADPTLKELDIDLQIQKDRRWNLTGYWATPQ